MLKTQDLIAVLAHITQQDVGDVMLKARRLREAGFFVKETRSPKSPRATPRHVANLMLMMISDVPAATASEAISRAEKMMNVSSTRLFGSLSLDGSFAVFSDQNHKFSDFLEFCLIHTLQESDHIIEINKIFSSLHIRFDTGAFAAEVNLTLQNSSPAETKTFFYINSDSLDNSKSPDYYIKFTSITLEFFIILNKIVKNKKDKW